MSIDIYTFIMGKYKNRTFTLRIDNALQDKVKIIAEREDRPVTSQYERIVREYIEAYETEHGEIPPPGEGGVIDYIGKCLIA